jgi:hypothetical protein
VLFFNKNRFFNRIFDRKTLIIKSHIEKALFQQGGGQQIIDNQISHGNWNLTKYDFLACEMFFVVLTIT